MSDELLFEISGNIKGKKNLYKRGRGKSFYKDPELVAFEEKALWQLKSQKSKYTKTKFPLSSDMKLYIMIDIMKRDKDMDNTLGTVFDLIQKSGIIENDILITELEVIKRRKQEKDLTRIMIKEII